MDVQLQRAASEKSGQKKQEQQQAKPTMDYSISHNHLSQKTSPCAASTAMPYQIIHIACLGWGKWSLDCSSVLFLLPAGAGRKVCQQSLPVTRTKLLKNHLSNIKHLSTPPITHCTLLLTPQTRVAADPTPERCSSESLIFTLQFSLILMTNTAFSSQPKDAKPATRCRAQPQLPCPAASAYGQLCSCPKTV